MDKKEKKNIAAAPYEENLTSSVLQVDIKKQWKCSQGKAWDSSGFDI